MKRALLSVIALACCVAGASAELKIGYIDSEVLKERLPEFRDALRTLDQLRQEYEKQAEDRRAKLVKLERDFRQQELLISEARRTELQDELEAKKQQHQQFINEKFGPDGELTRKNVELSEPIFKKINDAIKEMAKERKYDFIFDAAAPLTTLLFAHKDYDLTEQLLELMEKEKEEGQE